MGVNINKTAKKLIFIDPIVPVVSSHINGQYKGSLTSRNMLTLLVTTMLLTTVSAQDSRCANATRKVTDLPPISITETDPAGRALLTADAESDMSWRYSIDGTELKPLEEYLNFSRDASTNSYQLTLEKTFDLEEIFDNLGIQFPSLMTLTLFCQEPGRPESTAAAYLSVTTVNEFNPEFNQSSITISIPEGTAQNTPILSLIDWASDKDVWFSTREIVGFLITETTDDQALQWLQMANSYNGVISPRQTLDYDVLPANNKRFVLGLEVRDSGGRSGTATLTVDITDIDDLPPEFYFSGCISPCTVLYQADLSPNFTGEVDALQPAPIQARDRDSLGYSITYQLIQGPEDYESYLTLDFSNGRLTVLKELRGLQVQSVTLILEARESSPAGQSTSTSLLISLNDDLFVGSGGSIASSSSDDHILIAAIVLGVLFFIVVVCLVVGVVCFRNKYKKSIHPEGLQPIRKDESPMAEESPPRRPQLAPPPMYTNKAMVLGPEDHLDNGKTLSSTNPKEPLRAEEEIVTWMPIASNKDIVDLSDEDTLRRKKRQTSAAPADTKMHGHNNTSIQPRGQSQGDNYDQETEYAEVDTPPHSRKEREFFAGNPVASDSPNELPVVITNRLYSASQPPDTPDKLRRKMRPTQQADPGYAVPDEAEYSTPRESTSIIFEDNNNNNKNDKGTKDNNINVENSTSDENKDALTNEDSVATSGGSTSVPRKSSRKEDQRQKPPRRPGSRTKKSSKEGDDSHKTKEKDGDAIDEKVLGSSPRPQITSRDRPKKTSDATESQNQQGSDVSLNSSDRKSLGEDAESTNVQTADGEGEETEYSVPKSNRSSYVTPADSESKIQSDRNVARPDQQGGTTLLARRGNRPGVPAKPSQRYKQNSSRKVDTPPKQAETNEVDEPPYSTVDKLKKSPTSPSATSADQDIDADQSGEGDGSSANESPTPATTTFSLQMPSRRKKPRKRSKLARAPEEDVYDGTKDYEDLEVDSGFYTDTNKTKIKRSSRLPVVHTDPNDTRYWITVSNDF